MLDTPRLSTTCALIVCLVATQCGTTLFASDAESASAPALPAAEATSPLPAYSLSAGEFRVSLKDDVRRALNASDVYTGFHTWPRPLAFAPPESAAAFAQRGYRGRGGGRNGAVAALMIGAIASITGAAILVYANRPECRRSEFADGCGYGTKVVGGAVLSAGLVGVMIGTLTWR